MKLNAAHGRHLVATSASEWIFLGSLALAATALSAAERITFSEIPSAALGRTLPVAVVTPENAGPAGDAPVLYFLHGRGRHHRSLIESATAREALLAARFYVVLPQGEDGWYVDSPVRPADRYASYLAEVMAWAESNLRISRAPARTGIVGWSMGGYGAVRFAEAHPGRFGFVASIIGLLDFPRPATLPDGQNYRVPERTFGVDPAAWRTFNPLPRVEALRGAAITLVLATRGFELTMNERFVAALAEQRLEVRVHRLDGAHEFSVVERAVPIVISDAATAFARAALDR